MKHPPYCECSTCLYKRTVKLNRTTIEVRKVRESQSSATRTVSGTRIPIFLDADAGMVRRIKALPSTRMTADTLVETYRKGSPHSMGKRLIPAKHSGAKPQKIQALRLCPMCGISAYYCADYH